MHKTHVQVKKTTIMPLNLALVPRDGGRILPSQLCGSPGFPSDLVILSLTLNVLDIVHLVAPNGLHEYEVQIYALHI